LLLALQILQSKILAQFNYTYFCTAFGV